jgi:hypothetical protein
MHCVVGIFPNSAAVSSLVQSLKSGGFDVSSLTIMTSEEPAGYLASVGANFVRALEPVRISGDVDVEVPGLRSGSPGELEAGQSSPAAEALSELGVPDGSTDDFLAALDAGRCVAGFAAGDQAAIKSLFSSAGATRVVAY